MERPPTLIPRQLLGGLPAALLLPFVAGLAMVIGDDHVEPQLSRSAIFTVLCTAFLAVFVAVTWRRRPRAGVFAASHAVVWVPLVAVCAWQAVGEAIADQHPIRCGTGLMELMALALPIGGGVLLVLGALLGSGLAHRRTNGVLRLAAIGAVALSTIAFAFAVPRIGRPDPDTYVASLPEVAVLNVDSEVALAGRTYRYVLSHADYPVPAQESASAEPAPSRAEECGIAGLAEGRSLAPTYTGCPTVHVRMDVGHDLAIVEWPYASSRSRYETVAFHPSNGERVSLSPIDVADRIGPPIGWTLGAGLGALFGAAFAFAASRIRRRATRFEGADAKHHGAGLVELASGETIRVDVAAELPVGDVILARRAETMPTYRTTGAPVFGIALPGTLEELRNARTDFAASLDAVALAAAALGATPLVVARMIGLF
ncbi:MAG: hypothetical protein JWP87_5625 [Labilithrix sp.]|nr:hypothetical protein [Labilithrix sp.]